MLGHNARGARRADFLREVGWFAVSTGLVMGVAALVVWLIAAHTLGEDRIGQRTLLLSTLILLGLGNLPRVAEGDARLHWWIVGAVAVYLAVLYVPPLGAYHDIPLSAARFFELRPLSAARWGVVLAAVAPGLVLCWVFGHALQGVQPQPRVAPENRGQ
jgi:hypothetical protein